MFKVAMITRSTIFSARGGDTVQVLETARSLSCYDVAVNIKLTNEPIDYSQYDLLHFFNITRPADILFHISKAKKPFVVSTIFINYSEYDKALRKGLAGLCFKYLSADTIEYVKVLSRWIHGKDRLMSPSYLWKGQKQSIISVLNKANLILPNSTSEYKRLKRLYKFNSGYSIINNGIDPCLFSFNDEIEKDEKMVICVARIEGIKNQINLIRAMNNTAFKLFIIGDPAPNQQSYYRECCKIAAPNVQFIRHIKQEELIDYYQQAKVHVLPSWFETTGLSSLEAAAMGCNIVITDKGDTKEYFGNDAVYCNPSSTESIYEAVKKASVMPMNSGLYSRVTSSYTWQQAGKASLEAYKKVMRKT